MNKMLKNGLLAAGASGAIAFSGMVFSGEGSINKIKENFQTAINDIQTIAQDRDSILGKLDETINKYDTDIKTLNEKKAKLESDIVELNKQIDVQTGESKTEIARLEGELEKANKQIAELDSYIANQMNEIKNVELKTNLNEHNVKESPNVDQPPTQE